MNKRLRTILQYLFFFGLGFFFVWLSVKDLGPKEKSDIRSALRDARYLLFIPVFFILLLSHYVRAIRWAHKMHHKHLDRYQGESFGMLLVHKKYWEKIRKDKQAHSSKS